MPLKLPSTGTYKRIHCSYYEIEVTCDSGGKVLHEKMVITKSWVKDLKKEAKKQKPKFEFKVMDEEEM